MPARRTGLDQSAMVLLLSDVGLLLVGWAQAALYAAILLLVAARDAWLAGQQRAREAAWSLAARHPAAGRLLAGALGEPGQGHIGTTPRRPTSLGVVLAQPLQDGSSAGAGDLEPLAALLDWWVVGGQGVGQADD